jgi:hypothetical protein
MKEILLIILILKVTLNCKAQSGICFNSTISSNHLSAGTNPIADCIGDFNNDGNTDIAVANFNSSNVSVFISNGSGGYLTGVNYNVGTGPNDILTGDFDNDGNTDLAVTSYSVDGVSILLGNGTGVFGTFVNYPVGSKPNSICSNDFNGDGKIDLAISNNNSNDLSVIYGLGSGNFTAPVNYTVGINPTSIASADFNGDSIYDLVITNNGSNNLVILIGSAVGTFSITYSYTLPPTSNPSDLKVADFNGDGRPDIAVTLSYSSKVAVLNNSTFGGFTYSGFYAVGYGPNSLDVGDFNNDGKLDISTANSNVGEISVLIGVSSHSFLPVVNYLTEVVPYDIKTFDSNNDGNLDLLVTNYNTNHVSIVLGDGSGIFASPFNYPIGPDGASSGYPGAHQSIAIVDINNDSKLDLIVPSYLTSSYASVFLGLGQGTFSTSTSYPIGSFSFPGDYPVSICSADFNGDGMLDIATANLNTNNITVLFNDLINPFIPSGYPYVKAVGIEPKGICSGDFNGDGKIDLATCNRVSNNVSILLNTTGGSFATAVNYGVGSNPALICKGDFNYDGNLDLATVNNYSNNISLLFGTGLGTFLTAVHYSVGISPVSILSDDFNSDGFLDFVSANPGSNNVSILFGSASGVYSSAVNYNIGVQPVSLTSGDFNGDGYLDIVTANYNQSSLSTLIGSSIGTFTNGPVYGGGSLPKFISSGDLNNDGKKDIAFVNGLQVTVILNSPPSLPISGSNTICVGNSSLLSVVGASTYSWSTGVVSTPSISVSPSSTTSYSISGTSLFGCSYNSVKTITVNTLPLPTVTVNSGTICSGESFTMNPSGAISYTFSSGSSTVNPISTTIYTVSGSSIDGCIGTSSSSVVVNVSPTITITPSFSLICVGTSVTLTVSGVSTYTWSSGSLSPVFVDYPIVSTTYSVSSTNTIGCSSTETINILVDNTCQDVWPGDANSDGVADNLDVLELGLHYTQTGPNRSVTSNLWQSYFSNNWAGTITGGKNLNHSDCNGDGIIDANDTLAIYNNYGLTHAFRPELTTLTDPQLSIVSDQAFVEKGKWGSASIYLGDTTAPINTINGVAFTLNFDNTLIETDSIYLTYLPSFIDAGNNLRFRKRDFVNNKLYTATTHTNNTNVSGNGKIAVLHYKIKSTLTTDSPLNLSIIQGNSSNTSGSIVPLTTGTSSVLAVGASVGITSFDNSAKIIIYPNPAKDVLYFETTALKDNMSIVVYNALGQIVLKESIHSTKSKLAINALVNGVYFIDVLTNNTSLSKTKFIKE